MEVWFETRTVRLTHIVDEQRNKRPTETISNEVTGATELHDEIRSSGFAALEGSSPGALDAHSPVDLNRPRWHRACSYSLGAARNWRLLASGILMPGGVL